MDAADACAEGVNGESRTTLRKGGTNMSAAILKRKLRNFPVAQLTLRTVGA